TADLPPATLVILGRHLRAQEAVALLQHARVRYPADFWIHYELAQALSRLKPQSPQESIPFLTPPLPLRPQTPPAHLALANALDDNGALDEAVPIYEKGISLKPDDGVAYYHLGTALLGDRKRLPEAADALRKAIALNPSDHRAYHNLGRALFLQQK